MAETYRRHIVRVYTDRVSAIRHKNISIMPFPETFWSHQHLGNVLKINKCNAEAACVLKHIVKTYGSMEVQLHAFLTLTVDGSK
jgi:hypothetical protein